MSMEKGKKIKGCNIPKSFRLLNSLIAVATSRSAVIASWILSLSASSSGENCEIKITKPQLKVL